MKHTLSIRFIMSFAMLGILAFTACDDLWDEHYNSEPIDAPDKNILEIIGADPSLSSFYQLLQTTGMDTVLGSAKSFTVWAPTNDGLAGFNPENDEEAKRTVNNHITIGKVTSSNVQVETITMLNGKYNTFERGASGFMFGGDDLSQINIPATNGLLHVLDGYSPYLINLWEFIGEAEGIDSIRTYMEAQEIKIFDPINSIELGVNDSNEVIYDSVFIVRNLLLDQLGQLDVEDSIYSVMLPDNDAWDEAYARIAPYFNLSREDGKEARQRELTQQVLVKDMVFRGRIDAPETLDSVVSTTGSVFYDPVAIFEDATPNDASNGLGYITPQMPFADTASWFKEIRVEAESSVGRTSDKCDIFIRNSYGTGINASNNSYILVEPTAAKSYVEFSIPNVLSGTYNIYCVFIPPTIINPDKKYSINTSYWMYYIRTASGSYNFPDRKESDDYVTDSTAVTKMLVAQNEFGFANVGDYEGRGVTTSIRVYNETLQDMRIDCIILEPVSE